MYLLLRRVSLVAESGTFRRSSTTRPVSPPHDAVVQSVSSSKDSHTSSSSSSLSSSLLSVRVADRYGMPAELPPAAPSSFADLFSLCPHKPLRAQLERLVAARQWAELTPVQRAAIPIALEQRDLLCIAPTATGKTFSYAFPAMLRLAMGGGEGQRAGVESPLRAQMARGEVCRYCEMRVEAHAVCPMTGAPHPPPPSDSGNERDTRPPMSLSELRGVAEPRLLVLVPTAPLATQVRRFCAQLDADCHRVRSLIRASSAAEQREYLRTLEGCDALITAPESILPALYKRRLSLRRVQTLVLDEVDDLVSVNHFECVKMVLGALPKGHERPQRLLFGASLPTVAYDMIKTQMLLPSHRFILAEAKAAPLESRKDDKTGLNKTSAKTSNGGITHAVLMLGQVEKLGRLAALYTAGKLRQDQRVLIFCNSRHNVAYVGERLEGLVSGLRVATLTSRASATAREGAMRLFESGAITCLVCTDVLSRGIDFREVVYVVHYDMPQDFDTWIHRSGRCGRHGMPGYCYSFFQPENVRLAKPLVAHLRQMRQLVPLRLQEYATQSFVDIFKASLHHHPTRPYRAGDPQRQHPVIGRGTPRFPDYRQDRLNKQVRPL